MARSGKEHMDYSREDAEFIQAIRREPVDKELTRKLRKTYPKPKQSAPGTTMSASSSEVRAAIYKANNPQ